MKNVFRKSLSRVTALGLAAVLAVSAVPSLALAAEEGSYLHLAYNEKYKDYLITLNESEFDSAINLGGYKALIDHQSVANEGDVITRLYNKKTGEHFYTTSDVEIEALEKAGFKNEGVAFFSWGPREMGRYRDPVTGLHAYMPVDATEAFVDLSGYVYEGVAWTFGDIEEIPGVPSPVTVCEDVDEMNALAGTVIKRIPMLGVDDERFEVIDDEIAQYGFTYDGFEYSIRSANTLDDISGFYIDGDTAFANVDGNEIINFVENGAMRLAQWFTIDGQFVLYANANAVDELGFELMASKLRTFYTPEATVDPTPIDVLIDNGLYVAPVAERASMTIEPSESVEDGCRITIMWSRSAYESVQWILECSYDENVPAAVLGYQDGVRAIITYDEDGEIVGQPGIVESDLTGYFIVVDDALVWVNSLGEEVYAFIPVDGIAQG